MALFNAEKEMANRGVQLTLLNHHCELADPAGPYDEQSLLHGAMGLFIVGRFDIEKTGIIPTAEHIFWGAAHPKEVTTNKCDCGYPENSYAQKPPPPEVLSVAGLNGALRELRRTKSAKRPSALPRGIV